MRNFLFALLLLLSGLSIACAGSESSQSAAPPTVKVSSGAAMPAEKSLPKIVAFGDSLTAGLGLTAAESYPALLQAKLDADGYKYEVVNAGVSGDTSAGGLRRLDWSLDGNVRILILELGANDLLRGQPVAEMKKNLTEMIDRARARNVKVVLAGMYAPTNTGPDYQREVRDAFQSLAREHDVIFIPFLLEQVGGIASLNQEDGIHPNAQGTRIVADTVFKAIRPVLEKQTS